MAGLKDSTNIKYEKIILAVMLLMSFLLCFFQYFDHDEFEAIHTVWKLAKGQVMFVDFFQQKPPFFHYTMVPILKIFSETITTLYVCKFYMYCLFLGMIYSVYFLAKHVFGSRIKYLAPAILLSCTFFTDKLTEIRPDTMYILLSMVSICFLYRKIKLDRASIVYSAIFAGISFAVLPKAAIYVVCVSVILLWRLCMKKLSLSNFLLYYVVFFVTLVPFFIYLFSIINLEQYIFFNYSMSFKFLGAFSPLKNLKLLITQNTLFMILGLCGFLQLKGYRQKEIAFITIVLFLSVFLINVPNRQYYIPSMLFLSILAANFICKKEMLKKYSSLVLSFVIAYPLMLYSNQILEGSKKVQIAQIKYVLSVTNPGDKVYDGRIYFNIYRDDVDYFWFSVRPNGIIDTYKTLKPIEYDIYKRIETEKPKVIDIRYLDENHELIKKYYKRSNFQKGLFIRVNDNEK